MLALVLGGIAAGQLNSDPAPDCSLNGVKSPAGVCVCDKPWSGPECSTLNFRPVSFPQGCVMMLGLRGVGIQ